MTTTMKPMRKAATRTGTGCGCGCGGTGRCCGIECLARPNFFCGQLLTDADLSAAVQWSPFMSQNPVLNASASALLPGQGLKALYDEAERGPQYSILFNVIATF